MDPVYVTRVRGNFKNVVDVSFDQPFVFIHGANGTGKTSIINNIELALTGRVFDVAGRDTITNAKTLSRFIAADAGADEEDDPILFAEVHLSDGTKAVWRYESGQVYWRRPEQPWVSPVEGVLSTFFSAKTFQGGHTKGVEYLYSAFIGPDQTEVEPPEVEPEVRDRFIAFVRQHAEVDRAERLLEVVRTAEASARQHKRAADGFAIAADALATHEPDASSLPFLRQKAQDARVAQIECGAVADFGRRWMMRIVQHHARWIEEQINPFLPLDLTVGLGLTDAEFVVGLWDEDTFLPAPSGAQTVILATAIAIASSVHAKHRTLVVLPDRLVTESMLRALTATLENDNASIFVQAAKRPRGPGRAGWTYIDCDALASR